MSEDPKFMTVQATRSFNEYIQGAPYIIDTGDERMMTLLGAGYFCDKHNPALHIGPYADSAQLVVGNDQAMTEQKHVNVEEGYQPANDVPVPAKMVGADRATTAEDEVTSGAVGTESGGDSGDRNGRRSSARKPGRSRNN